MWVYRRPPEPRRLDPSRRLVFESAEAGVSALAEIGCECAATGVTVGTAHASISVVVDMGGPLKTASAHATTSVSISAIGRDADSPGGVAGVAITASATARSIGRTSVNVAASLVAGDGDVLIEGHAADTVIAVSAVAGQARTANVSVTASVVAVGFALAPDTDGEALASVAASLVAQGVSLGAANALVAAHAAASEGTTIGFPLPAVVVASAAASATFLGPASAFCAADIECSAFAIGTRVSGAEIGRAPAGRSVDWRALVEGSAREVPDYEFGHQPTKRRFFQQ